jgi:hypothetical protein
MVSYSLPPKTKAKLINNTVTPRGEKENKPIISNSNRIDENIYDNFSIKLRPVVDAKFSIYAPISKFLSDFLMPFIKKQPNIITNPNLLIKILENIECPEGHHLHLITLDVVSLYPNMKTDIVIESLKSLLPEIRELSEFDCPISDISIINIVQFMLDNNLITFNGIVYRQLSGIIMGDNMAPALANIYVLYLQRKMISNFLDNPNILLNSNYIDDILIITAVKNSD